MTQKIVDNYGSEFDKGSKVQAPYAFVQQWEDIILPEFVYFKEKSIFEPPQKKVTVKDRRGDDLELIYPK